MLLRTWYKLKPEPCLLVVDGLHEIAHSMFFVVGLMVDDIDVGVEIGFSVER